jgi:hypothetical protein
MEVIRNKWNFNILAKKVMSKTFWLVRNEGMHIFGAQSYKYAFN